MPFAGQKTVALTDSVKERFDALHQHVNLRSEKNVTQSALINVMITVYTETRGINLDIQPDKTTEDFTDP